MDRKEEIADLEQRIKEYEELSKDNGDNIWNLSTPEYMEWIKKLQKLRSKK